MFWQTATFTLDITRTRNFEVLCSGGDYIYGGGAWVEAGSGLTPLSQTAPSGDLHGRYVTAANADTVSHTVHAYALCGPDALTMTSTYTP